MQYRIDTKSGNKLSALAFGCMRFPSVMGKIDLKATEKLIVEAVNQGVNYFDTAYIYPGSEETLGKILKKNNLREKIYLATKLSMMHRKSKEDFDKCLNIQLKRLNTDYIDYYLIHMITDLDMWKRLCDLGIESWIEEKKKEGKIKQLGFSFHGNQQEFLKILDAYDWEFCMIQYNYLNINYQAGKTGLLKAHEKGIPVMIMEPLLGGDLANKLPKKVLSNFKKTNSKLSPAAWALKWLWNHKEVTSVLSGMNKLEQLEDNIKTAGNTEINSMSEAEIATIDEAIKIFNDSYKIPCTGCNYCMPCPKNVDIPACFSSCNTYYAISKRSGFRQYIMSIGVTSKKSGVASNCISCGVCEKNCPQNIEIAKALKLVEKKLEPFWMKWILKIARKFLVKKEKPRKS